MGVAPWEEVAIKLIGHWEVKVNGRKVEFNVLTCLDHASNLVKLIRIDNKTAKHIVINSCSAGFAIILDQYAVYMTREANSWAVLSNGYWKCSASRMYA